MSAVARIRAGESGRIAARCSGVDSHPSGYTAAHTSPIYVKCGDSRAFDGPAARHMLTLVQGSIEYMRTLATAYDEPARKRLIGIFNEARKELEGRLIPH